VSPVIFSPSDPIYPPPSLLPSLPPSFPQTQIEVIVHPLVLLSTVDHYNRVAKDTRKRVVGVLLGTTWRGRIDITNSFAGREGGRMGGSEGGKEGGRLKACGGRVAGHHVARAN